MNRLQPRRGNIAVYLLLLAAAITAMVIARNKALDTADASADVTADTIFVAVQIGPNGVSLQGDTLSGYGYNLARRLGANANAHASIEAFTQPQRAIADLLDGKYDAVICDTTGLQLDPALTIEAVADTLPALIRKK